MTSKAEESAVETAEASSSRLVLLPLPSLHAQKTSYCAQVFNDPSQQSEQEKQDALEIPMEVFAIIAEGLTLLQLAKMRRVSQGFLAICTEEYRRRLSPLLYVLSTSRMLQNGFDIEALNQFFAAFTDLQTVADNIIQPTKPFAEIKDLDNLEATMTSMLSKGFIIFNLFHAVIHAKQLIDANNEFHQIAPEALESEQAKTLYRTRLKHLIALKTALTASLPLMQQLSQDGNHLFEKYYLFAFKALNESYRNTLTDAYGASLIESLANTQSQFKGFISAAQQLDFVPSQDTNSPSPASLGFNP